jgi:hypothetical protein
MSHKLPQEFSEYQWIADRFSKIEGVNEVKIDGAGRIILNGQHRGSELYIVATNNSPGKYLKEYELPLRTTFYLDYAMAPANCPNDWDINKFPDPDMIMLLAEAKAKVVFENVRPN